MASAYTLYRNYSATDSTSLGDVLLITFPPINAVEDDMFSEIYDWSRDGYEFVGWNTARDGSGTSYNAGDTPPRTPTTYYATWREGVVTPPVEILLGNTSITTLSSSGSVTLTTAGMYVDKDITINYTKPSGGTPTLQSKTVSPTTSQQTIIADSGYDGLSSVQINAMPSGSAGTPTATKGTVSNHSISITPKVTNTTGYITGGTKNGTAVTVSASELVSGTLTITQSGTEDVTNYANVSIARGSAETPTTTITANPEININSNGLISATVTGLQSITPTVTEGYIIGGTGGQVYVDGYSTLQITDSNLIPSNIKVGASIFGVQGGYSNYRLIHSSTFSASTTNTSASKITTINVPDAYTSNAILYIKIRDTAGPRLGYFLGSDCYCFNYQAANNSTSAATYWAKAIHRYAAGGTVSTYTGGTTVGYGLYPYQVKGNGGEIQIYGRYSSSYSLTINGTYRIEVYLLDYVGDDGNPYEYTDGIEPIDDR